nr:hypothetical protein [Tanacetum cinerariifolium]
QNETGYNVFANHLQHSEQSELVSNTCLVETNDGNVTPDSPDMCEGDIQNEENNVESDDERVALANLIANLKINVDENKKIQKQLKKANTLLVQELKECKAILAETRSLIVQRSRIQCFNCKEFGHFAKECRKLKRVKDSAYHKEKMLLCKQVEQGVPLQAEQYDWLADTDEKNDQNDVESDDERVALANLIANLKLNVDENKKIQKQLKKANTTLTQELKECKTILAETSKSLGESISVRDSCLVSLQTNQTEFEKYKAFNDSTTDYDKLKRKPDPFSNSLDRIYFPKKKSVPKANVSEGLSKPVTAQTLPQTSGKLGDEEIDEHELEAHYSFVAKIQDDLPEDSNSNDTPLE